MTVPARTLADALPNVSSAASPTTTAPASHLGPLEISFVRALFFLAVLASFTLYVAEIPWGTADPVWPFVTAVCVFVAYSRLKAGKKPFLGRFLGNVLSVAAMAKLMLDLTTVGALMTAVGKLLGLLLWVKLLQEKKNRDYVQVLLLAFGQMLVASVLTQELWFGVVSLAFLLVTTWVLLLFHFKREGDGDYHPLNEKVVDWKSFRTSELISRAFLGLMLVALVLTGIGTAVVFVSIPRFTAGWLNAVLPSPPTQTSGLSDRVRLGGHGTITKNHKGALVVEYRDKPDWPLLYRAVVQETYDPRSHTWLADNDRAPIDVGKMQFGPTDAEKFGHAVMCDILDTQSPRTLRQLATPGQVVAEQAATRGGWRIFARMQPPAVDDLEYFSRSAVLQTKRPVTDRIDYSVIVRKPPTGDAFEAARINLTSRRRPFPLTNEFRQRLRQWTRENVPERVRGEGWTVARVKRMVTALSSAPYSYTLEQQAPPPGVDPIEFFLFERKAGHCEYFASALAMLMWAEGLNVRMVTGFAGGVNWLPNDEGKFIDHVTYAHAHAWIEADVAGFGWVPFNPSPAIGADPEAMNEWQLWLAALQYRWQKHVVRFDLAQQLDILNWMRETFEAVKNWIAGVGENLLGSLSIDTRAIPSGLLILVGIVALVVPVGLLRMTLKRWKWRPAHAQKSASSAFAPLQDLLAALERRGVRRSPAITAAEFLRSPAVTAWLDQPLIERFLTSYHTVRFGGAPLDAKETAALRSIVAALPTKIDPPTPPRPAPTASPPLLP